VQSRLAAVVIALLAVPILAQTPRTGEQIQVTLVEVPVNVVDRNGDAIRGLKSENFQLLDDGHARAVTHFETIDLSSAARGRPSTEAVNPASRRNFLLLFDMNGSSPGSLARAREAAGAFVGGAGLTADRLAVGSFSVESGFHLLTSFTTDTRLVSAAIRSVGQVTMFQPADPLLLSSIELREQADAAAATGGRMGGDIADDLRETARAIDRASNDIQRQFIDRTLSGYGQLARLLDRVPGRKQVILLSEGFDAKMLHGRESDSPRDQQEEERLRQTGMLSGIDTDNRYGNTEVAGQLQKMVEICRRADVVLHAIDIKGIRASGDTAPGAARRSNESLYLVTRGTGGEVFKNSNSLDEDFRRLLRGQEVVYVLAFEGPSSAPGKFHDLKVRLVGVPGARAYARSGYFEPGADTTAVERTLTAGEIIMNQIPVADLAVHTLPTPFPRKEGPAQVPVIVEIDGPSLMRTASGNQIHSEVFIYAFDDHELIRDFVHQVVGLDLAKLRDRLQGKGVRLYETLMLPAGDYSVRTLVRAGSQPVYGYSGATLRVPAAGDSTVLGLTAVDERPALWVMVKPPDRHGAALPYPFTVAGSMLVPAVMPVLQSNVAAHLGLYLQRVPADPLTIAASIQGGGASREAAVHVASRTVDGEGGAKLLLDFTPPALPAGQYSLIVHVTGQAGPLNPLTISFLIR
jgi:VWFA-related protein